MTRNEEIQKLIDEEMGIDNYGSCDFQVGVIYGVKHADKTMIDKACDWLQCMALDYMQGDITDVKWESMFTDLRNYIENGDD